MPAKRTRLTRAAVFSPDTQAWLESEDADRFFTAPEDYLDMDSPTGGYHGGPIGTLPGVLPWFPSPLSEVWCDHIDGTTEPCDQESLAFLIPLHEEYQRIKQGRRRHG